MNYSPLDLNYDAASGEERFRSVGMTDAGRYLVLVWTLRDGKVRADTAFPATAASRKCYRERLP